MEMQKWNLEFNSHQCFKNNFKKYVISFGEIKILMLTSAEVIGFTGVTEGGGAALPQMLVKFHLNAFLVTFNGVH